MQSEHELIDNNKNVITTTNSISQFKQNFNNFYFLMINKNNLLYSKTFWGSFGNIETKT